MPSLGAHCPSFVLVLGVTWCGYAVLFLVLHLFLRRGAIFAAFPAHLMTGWYAGAFAAVPVTLILTWFVSGTSLAPS